MDWLLAVTAHNRPLNGSELNVKKILCFLLLLPSLVWAGSVTLQWDPNIEADLAGYKIYQSTTGNQPFSLVNSVRATTVTVPNLDSKLQYYFAVTAYNLSGAESSYSNIVTVTPIASTPADFTCAVTNGVIKFNWSVVKNIVEYRLYINKVKMSLLTNTFSMPVPTTLTSVYLTSYSAWGESSPTNSIYIIQTPASPKNIILTVQ